MKRKIVLTLIIMVLTSAALSASGTPESHSDFENPVREIPSFSTKTVNRETVSSEIFGDHKLTVVNFWGTFCGPCIEELPEIQKIYREYENQGVNVLGIVVDGREGRAADEAAALLKSAGCTYSNILPSAEMEKGLLSNIDFVPLTIFVDSHRNVLKTSILGGSDARGFKQAISEALNEIGQN